MFSVSALRAMSFFKERFEHFLIHDQPFVRHARLTISDCEAAFNQPVCHSIQVRIVAHDDRIVSTQFKRKMLQILRRMLHDDLADGAAAGKRNHRHIRMIDQRHAGFLAIPDQQVESLLGHACLKHQFPQPQACQRAVLGQLHNNGIAGRQRPAELIGHHFHGKIEGNDAAHNPARLTAAHRLERGERRELKHLSSGRRREQE